MVKPAMDINLLDVSMSSKKTDIGNCPVLKIHPSCTITSAVQRLYKTGSCHKRIPLSRATPSSMWAPAEDVLEYALAHPESGVGDISRACFHSKLTVWNTLHAYGAYPHRPVLAQELIPGDQKPCFDF
ncbi:DUF4817 domain-containing protein [Trichonephila clavipes]|nr:DUF4817 domain-containing protein [Trichonephila clavipes]